MNQLELTFSGFEGYEDIRQQVHDFIQLSLPEEDMFVEVAVSEAITNAIKHGNNNDQTKKVKVKLVVYNNKRLIVRVKDQGDGFDWEKHIDEITNNKERFLKKSLNKDCGRGILIIQQVMDYITYNKKGNEIFLMKLLNENDDAKTNLIPEKKLIVKEEERKNLMLFALQS